MEKMKYIHVKNIERYHPGYKDRQLLWAKINLNMAQGDPEMEMIESEIDKWRFICIILLELQAKKPLPLSDLYFQKKGFDVKKRSMSLTLQMLHNFIDVVTEDSKVCVLEESRVEESRVECNVTKSVTDQPALEPPAAQAVANDKIKYLSFVYMTQKEYEKLVAKFGDEETRDKITKLNNYIGSKGTKYKSHYHTILMWDDRDSKRI